MPNDLTREEAEKLKSMLTRVGLEVPKEVTAILTQEEEEIICEKCGCPCHPCLPCEEVVLLQGNHTDDTYKDLLRLILREGRRKKNRTGVDTIGVFGAQAKFDVDLDAFPILTTKKIWFKGIVHELLWFIKGDTNIKYLVDNGVSIWNEWAYQRYLKECGAEDCPDMASFIARLKELPPTDPWVQKYGDLGEGTYGGMWRRFPNAFKVKTTNSPTYSDGFGNVIDTSIYVEQPVDQLEKVIDKLKNSPTDRRMIVSAWHPYWVDHCALPPCHCMFHFHTEVLTEEERKIILQARIDDAKKRGEDVTIYLDEIPKRRLNCLLYQRSCDTFLGVPFNITSYCLLTALIAHCINMVPGVFTHTYGDLHIYENHLEQVKEQLSRTPKLLPKLWLNPKVRNLFDFKYEDIKLEGYNSHPAIKAPIAV